jgi:hypothetical protein
MWRTTLRLCEMNRQRQVVLPLQPAQQVDDLGLDGDVERGDGLVAYHQLRAQDHGAGDADALALAAGEFMRVAPEHLRRQPHLAHRGHDALIGLALRGRARRVLRGRAMILPTVMRGSSEASGVLEDDLHVAPALCAAWRRPGRGDRGQARRRFQRSA